MKDLHVSKQETFAVNVNVNFVKRVLRNCVQISNATVLLSSKYALNTIIDFADIGKHLF